MLALFRVLFVLFALSCMGGTEQARAFEFNGRDRAFCENGLRSPQELAGKIERSLAADPSGNRRLQDCLATPNDFLEGFRLADPKAADQLRSLSDLSAYVRSLVVMTPNDTEFSTSCLQVSASGKHLVKMDCIERPIRNGEVIYGNPKTNVLVLMSSCANPGAVPAKIVVEAKCIEVHHPSMDMKANVRYAYIAPNSLSSKCHALLLAGENQKRGYGSECPDRYPVINNEGLQVMVNCVWDEVEVAVSKNLGAPSKVQNASGSYKPRALGTNVWYLPLDARTGEAAICWDLPDGRVATIGVRREHYVKTDDGRLVATITAEHVNAAFTEQW